MSNPKYMKDETGFCYTWTEALSNQKHLTPWDGPIHPNGFADPEGDSAPAPVSTVKKGKTKPVSE